MNEQDELSNKEFRKFLKALILQLAVLNRSIYYLSMNELERAEAREVGWSKADALEVNDNYEVEVKGKK